MPTAESETNPVPDDARFFRQSISPHPIGRSSKARHCSSLPPSSASAESYSAGQMLTPEHPHGLPYRLRYNLPSARTAVGPVRSTSPSLLRVSAPMDALIGVRAGVALCGRTPSTVPAVPVSFPGVACSPLPLPLTPALLCAAFSAVDEVASACGPAARLWFLARSATSSAGAAAGHDSGLRTDATLPCLPLCCGSRYRHCGLALGGSLITSM